MIDVSQSVEKTHPYALEFLKRDIFNMNNYFEKNNVLVFKLKSLFDYITSSEIKTEEESLDFIEKMKEETMEEPDS